MDLFGLDPLLPALPPVGLARLKVYTDGGCSPNPGPGGWAWAVDEDWCESGFEENTTNQRMELYSALRAIEVLGSQAPLEIVSDSAYLVNCFHQQWYTKWMERGWRRSASSPLSNADLWKPLVLKALYFQVQFTKVKGHSGDVMNDLVDRLAVSAYRSRV